MKQANKQLLLLCFCAFLLVTVSAAGPAPLEQSKTFWQVIQEAIAVGISAVTNYVIAPILQVVDVVVQTVVAPVTDGASQLAMNVAVKQFCNLVVKGTFSGLGDDALVINRCQMGGLEEVLKAFSKKWVENGDNTALLAKAMN